MGSDINTVLFDLDGTLFDTAPDLALAMNATLKQHNREPIEFNKFRQHVSYGSPKMLRHSFGIEPNHPDYHTIREEFLAHYRLNIDSNTQLFPGIQALLDHINQQQLRWGIITNKPTDLTQQLLQHYEFIQTSACIICGDTLKAKKPDPAQLLHACELLNINPQNAIYVGDSESDIIAAKAANMPSIAVSYGYYPHDSHPSQWHADHIADSPEQIISWLNQHPRKPS
ncbi:MAG: phosphoglycolate phosphatase [Gammaproteobacteria bacterium]|nr:phosphoglycolate phosphatase [Gammaproteobacteria bacterium]MCH9744765.1 phosphoglycolate phosphatase [Gammaproteobacteria bacterium]